MNTTAHPLRSLRYLWGLLTEPSNTIQSVDQRRQARLLTALLITLFGALLAITFLPFVSSAGTTQAPLSSEALAAIGLLLGLYLLSRTRYTQLVVGIFIAGIDFLLFSTFFSVPIVDAPLYYLVVPVFMSGIFLSVGATFLLCFVNIGIMAFAPTLIPQAAGGAANPAYYLGTVTAAILVFIQFRNVLEKDRRFEITQALKKVEVLNQELTKTNQELVESIRVKDEFLALMSHELRTPLNAILGFTGIMIMDSERNEQNRQMLERVEANGKRLLTIINDILDISKIEAGHLELVPESVFLRDVLERLQKQMGILAEQKGLKLSISVENTLSEIYMDQDALFKILTNLVANGIKFTEAGEVSLKIREQNQTMIIEVSDTGIGIPAHKQSIIFERFQQVDSSTTRQFGGTGLGLSIVRHLCQAMNGTVSVTSNIGKGSTFTVSLPLDTPVVHKITVDEKVSEKTGV